MKIRILGSFFATLFLAQAALAAVPTNDTRLSLQVRPYDRSQLTAEPTVGKSRTLAIDSRGLVYVTECVRRAKCKTTVVDFLSSHELSRIEDLIRVARKTKPTVWTGPTCLAIPFETAVYSADNGKVTLWAGARPCGAPTSNKSAEAKKLIEILNKWNQKSGKISAEDSLAD